jgi:hypothetical protein
MNKRTKPEYVDVTKRVAIDPARPWGRKKVVKVKELRYPPSLKHFIVECKMMPSFKPKIQNIRQSTIDILLNSNKNN